MTEAQLLYRFTVKCDRDTNREIERLAKACNVSAATYVQKHFETIMGGEGVAIKKPEPVAPPPLPIATRIKRQKQPPPADRILAALIGAKRAGGLVSISQPMLAQITLTSIPTLIKYLDEMVKDGVIEIAREGQKGRPTLYRILKASGGED
jgi:hypothetical protein